MNLFSYWKLRKLKRGISICIIPSFNCNYNCDYCILKNGKGKLPKNKNVKSPEEWLFYIKSFPVKIGEVIISGGEPTLYPGFTYLVNELLRHKYFVTIYTNLSNPGIFNGISQSRRFLIISTYHNHASYFEFINALKIIKHEIKIDEIGEVKKIRISNLKKYWTEKESRNNISCLRVGTDGTIFTNCFDLNEYYIDNSK
jgi:organic radical activating enzyme